MNCNGIQNQITNNLEDLSKLFSVVEKMHQNAFDNGLKDQIVRINALTHSIPQHRSEIMQQCFEIAGKYMDDSVILRHAREKPFGYAGDFQLIDWIYDNKPLSEGKGRFLDKAFLRSPSAQSVRNRKVFLTEKLYTVLDTNRKTSVLNLGCGPCRELYDALQILDFNGYDCEAHCIDSDPRAVSYARSFTDGRFYGNIGIEWEVANVFHIRPKRTYSLIWASGLFDYLNNRLAVALIRRMWKWSEDGGKIIIGNFHPSNPDRNLMEWCLAWFLIHRSQSEMINLCMEAGISPECVDIEYEPLGINLFLIISKK